MREAVRVIIIRDDQILLMQRNKHGDLYYTLIGGGIEEGEAPEAAAVREIQEETSMKAKPETLHLVFQYEAGPPYGTQLIYTCEVEGDEPMLHETSEEALEHARGENLYTPMWVPLSQLTILPFRPLQVAGAIDEALKYGFPESVKTI